MFIAFIIYHFTVCADSDGLKGFSYSHEGYWKKGWHDRGSKTKTECADTCLQDCVAFVYAPDLDKSYDYYNYNYYNPTGHCYHYDKQSNLITENEIVKSPITAYIKCLGSF